MKLDSDFILIFCSGGLYGLGYGWGGLYGWGLGYPFWGKRATTETKPIHEITECVYNKNNSMVMCIGIGEMVQCETELKWDKDEVQSDFVLHGIAKSDTTPRSYRLLPRTMTNSAWLDSTYKGKQVSLFSSEKLDHFGLRVIDEDCFNRMVGIYDLNMKICFFDCMLTYNK